MPRTIGEGAVGRFVLGQAGVNQVEPAVQLAQGRSMIRAVIDGVVGHATECIQRGGRLAHGLGQRQRGGEKCLRPAPQRCTACGNVGDRRKRASV